MNQKLFEIGVFVLLTAATGCGGVTAPDSELNGAYSASQWVTTSGSVQTNQVVAGSTLDLSLDLDGGLSGHLHVAASGGNPAFDADMAGTWTHSGNTLKFNQSADTFVRDLIFSVVRNGDTWALAADQVISGTRVQLTLERITFAF
jgi:hypothetical protein